MKLVAWEALIEWNNNKTNYGTRKTSVKKCVKSDNSEIGMFWSKSRGTGKIYTTKEIRLEVIGKKD